ncbi:MAG TPA: cell wall-binding repeat-containing protein [Solirubrobacterales bacterium]
MSADRPINADVPEPAPTEPPASETPPPPEPPDSEAPPSPPELPPPAQAPQADAEPITEETALPEEAVQPTPREAPETPPKPPSPPKRRRQPLPGALKLVFGLVAVAIVFILAAVLGGSGGAKKSTDSTPAPAPQAVREPSPEESATAQSSEELGYPAFATNNTTRIGGSDPAANAAAVALAVFPSPAPSQRPAAVTLVSEEDWAGAIAAAVLMAAPVRAPLLFSNGDGLPDPTSEALAALDPQGDSSTGGAGAFQVGEVAAPAGTKTTSVPAGTAAAEAAEIAALRDRLAGAPPEHLLVTSSEQAGIAMPAAAWAARSGDPVLFTDAKKLPSETAAALKRHPGVPVYVLGPSSAISAAVLHEIAALDPHVKRVAGKNPVANAIAFARYADNNFGWDVNDPGHGFVLAREGSPLDAAAAAPLSASGTWGPLLLTDSAGSLPAELRSYFLDVKPGYTTNPTRAFYNHVWVIGDQEAIDLNQQAEVNELAELARIGGEG